MHAADVIRCHAPNLHPLRPLRNGSIATHERVHRCGEPSTGSTQANGAPTAKCGAVGPEKTHGCWFPVTASVAIAFTDAQALADDAIAEESGDAFEREDPRPYQPCMYGEPAWRRAVSAELRRLGQPALAESFETCGKSARVWHCLECGADPAAVLVGTHCRMRACPTCARVEARDNSHDYADAIEALGLLPPESPHTVVPITELFAECLSRAHRRVLKVRKKASRENRADEIEKQSAWRWRWATITLRWSPRDPREYTVDRLRARARRAMELARHFVRAVTFDDTLRAAVAAVARCEMSDKGTVHVHILWRGPYVKQDFVNREVFGEAWTITDPKREGTVILGEVRPKFRDEAKGVSLRRAVVETLKYALKAPSPLRVAFMAGERERVIHPTLAARWMVATAKCQLRTPFGAFRPALAAVRAKQKERRDGEGNEKPKTFCVGCGCEVPSVGFAVRPTQAIAREILQRARDGPGSLKQTYARAKQQWRKLLRVAIVKRS